jgi:hypothetical protein
VRGEVSMKEGFSQKTLREGARMDMTISDHAQFRNRTGKQVELLFLEVTPPTVLSDDKILTLKSYA